GCSGDRCSTDDVDCIVDHMVLAEHQDDGARLELVKADSTLIESKIPLLPCAGTMCNGSCVNTDADEGNCGGCGTLGKAGQRCIKGACACPAGETVCGGSCVNLNSAATDCGACGHACMGPMGTSTSSAASSSSSSSSTGSSSASSG